MGDKVPIETYNHICKSLDIAEATIKSNDIQIERLKKNKQYFVKLFCNQGTQYCHVCEDKSCGDNINKH